MKRVIEPFAVEYKRRPKRGKTADTSIWSGSLGDEIKSLMRTSEEAGSPSSPSPQQNKAQQTKQAAKAVFSKPKSVRAGLKPEGRILESRPMPEAEPIAEPEVALEPDEIIDDGMEAEPVAAPRRRGRPARSRTEPVAEPAGAAPEPVRQPVLPVSRPAVVESLAAPTERPAPKAESTKGVSRVAQRRARMKGLHFEERWKWNLPD